MHTPRISRRSFLQSTAAAGALGIGSLCPRDSFALKNASASPINFGFSLYGMRSLTVFEALKVCAGIGYDSVELVSTKTWACAPESLSKSDRKSIRHQLQDLKLALPGLMENLHVVVDAKQHRTNLDRLKAAGELGHALSPKHPPVIETVLGGRPETWETKKGTMVRNLREWAKAGKSANTVIAVKAHVGGALHTPEDARWLVDELDSPWIKLAYDFSHFQLYGFDLEKSLKMMIDDSVFIHIKDKTGTSKKFQFLLPGDGDIDYATYFKLLKQSSYKGGVIVEVSGQIHGKPGYDPIRAAKHSYTNLAPVLRKTGLWEKS